MGQQNLNRTNATFMIWRVEARNLMWLTKKKQKWNATKNKKLTKKWNYRWAGRKFAHVNGIRSNAIGKIWQETRKTQRVYMKCCATFDRKVTEIANSRRKTKRNAWATQPKSIVCKAKIIRYPILMIGKYPKQSAIKVKT